MRLTTLLACAVAVLSLSAEPRPGEPAARLVLKPRDHICVIGNTLADRMQHDGWLDALLHARFPTHDLTIRHLGFSADELKMRMRSADFGTPDQWLAGSAPPPRRVPGADADRFELTQTKADVVFAFFGYNESFAGKAGLPAFKKDLEAFVKHTTSQKYNGRSNARLVLFSPIAHEDLKSAHLPDGKANNERLQMYAAAMAEVAAANKIPFVDLFAPTKKLYAEAAKPLTINGIHLDEAGNKAVAQVIDEALFGKQGKTEAGTLVKLREAAKDRNWHWFHRYRVTDGYSTYGGRAWLTFAPDRQSNYVVAQRELRVLDVMTRNRDRRIWAVARGEDPSSAKRDPLPDFIPVKTNKPGKGPKGTHLFLSAEKAVEKMKVAKGMKANVFASEEMFPEFVNPVQMAWDAKGRLWVAVWPTYPHWKPGEQRDDKILILEDTKGTGKADKCTVFADKLHCPTGFEFYDGGVLVAQVPDLWYLKDTTGDGKADLKKRVVHGLDSADTHHASNSFAVDPGGAVYFQEGTFHQTQVETPYGKPERCSNAGVYRYSPRTQKFEVYVSYGFANPHGHVFDKWGRDIVIDGTGAQPYDAALFSARVEYPRKHSRIPTVWGPPSRPCPGMEVLSSKHFPDEMQGDILVPNVIGFHGIFRIKPGEDGASLKGKRVEDVLSSTDENFRPSDVKIGPDGAIYFCDWHNPIIGHMQHNLRDPSRDRSHGRVYRVTCENRPLSRSPRIAGEKLDALLKVLEHDEDRVRARARIELGGRPTKDVLAAAGKWLASLDPKGAGYEHALLEGLWLHQSHDSADEALLGKLLKAKDAKARAAATRVLGYWREKVGDPIGKLRTMAADPAPRVRLEAVRAASFFTAPEALEIVLVSQEQPTDRYLDLVREQSLKTLQPYVQEAIRAGKKIAFQTPAGARYFLRTVATADLMKMERTRPVCYELLFRPGVGDEARQAALASLSSFEKKPEMRMLVEAIASHDKKEAASESVAFDLLRLMGTRTPAALAKERGALAKLAADGSQPLTRQLGYVALIAADGGSEKAWAMAEKSVKGLTDLADAVPMVRDPSARAALYPRLLSLLEKLPAGLGGGTEKRLGARYVRIELPGRLRTLTLAEVQVFADGVNVARKGTATQHSTAHGGPASKAIDGNTSGAYGDGGQTHTREGVTNPWWELDLGKEFPLERIVVWNRADGNLDQRLKGWTLKVMDGGKNVVFQKKGLPKPEGGKASFAVGNLSPLRIVRRAAIKALPAVRGKEAETVKAIAPFVKDEGDRPAAIRALQRVPARLWPAGEAKPVLDELLAYVRKVPAKARTADTPLDALQLADGLAALLPAAEAKKARRELDDLGVRVLRIGTLLEKMLFDRERLVVQAGKPVEILFENTDLMPHNFVIIQPGSLVEIGELAEKTATDPRSAARQYVPPSPKVILGSRLLQPRNSQKLDFTAPAKPGVYPYVCTYPGHWRRMHGALYVVASLEDYQANPEAYLAKNPPLIKDELLKFNRPRTEWKNEELAPALAMLHDRNFASGKQLFTVASCASCHKFGGQGQEFGPDLAKLDPKWKNADVLKHVLEPSLKIDDKYRTWTLRLNSGKVATGIILSEKDGTIELIENPLVAGKPRRIKSANVAAREASKASMMPKGLLDKLTREEVLDLMAYVLSKGDPKSRMFGGHMHGH